MTTQEKIIKISHLIINNIEVTNSTTQLSPRIFGEAEDLADNLLIEFIRDNHKAFSLLGISEKDDAVFYLDSFIYLG